MTSERKTETVEISTKQGKVEYAKVSARLAEYHKDHRQKAEITTTYQPLDDGNIIFTAVVVTDSGEFTGHSMCKLGNQKAVEKCETVAVGRALAFAGYLATGEIATAEEMADFETAVSVAQLNGLKMRYAKENEAALKGKDRPAKAQAFNSWAREIVGQDVDYRDATSWQRDWYEAAWAELTGADSSVPFDS